MNKFYINRKQGQIDYAKAYDEAIEFAQKEFFTNSKITRIVFLSRSKNNIGPIKAKYGSEIQKKMMKGYKFDTDGPIFKIEFFKSYEPTETEKDLIITIVLKDDEIFELEYNKNIVGIIVIPWINDEIESWIKTWGVLELRTNKSAEKYLELSCPIKIALKEIDNSINPSILHSIDDRFIVKCIRALYKNEKDLNPKSIQAYLLRELNWRPDYAKKVRNLTADINSGKKLSGKPNNNLDDLYGEWADKCKNI